MYDQNDRQGREVRLQEGFILHQRAYRESSAWLQLLCLQWGRIDVLAKGIRGSSKKQARRGELQAFQPLLFSWGRRGNIAVLHDYEVQGKAFSLNGKLLLCGWYINELLLRLLPAGEENTAIFYLYQRALVRLARKEHAEIILREFELHLLEALGYALILDVDVQGQSVQSEQWYSYYLDEGFIATRDMSSGPCFKGCDLLNIAQLNWHKQGVLTVAKKLFREVLQNYLGNRPLKTRLLFAQMYGK